MRLSVGWFMSAAFMVAGSDCGLDELSEGCLVSLRSGVSVKLLGCEDASMEDVILHAFAIASAWLGKDHPDYFSKRDTLSEDDGTGGTKRMRTRGPGHGCDVKNKGGGKASHPHVNNKTKDNEISRSCG
ncbi:hypothetical protein SLEP1_g47361 [Rubroshorea leprosula]|uniref:Uncharacterized protein n=1 Tax=Rubroshorea leprosula TaxID=152421 RepID=A0AAV5LR54_9ROSI|nr:hypothetical protein SLEP1_g47361 [Rubroshorea leprosula]